MNLSLVLLPFCVALTFSGSLPGVQQWRLTLTLSLLFSLSQCVTCIVIPLPLLAIMVPVLGVDDLLRWR